MSEIYYIIYNPYANRGGAVRYLDAFVALLQCHGAAYVVHETNAPGHATDIARRLIADGAKYIIAMGGDGTVHEVVNGYAEGDDVVFGVLPAGTGNDVAAMLGIPPGLEDIEAAARGILQRRIRHVDYIKSAQGAQTVLFFSYGIAAQMILDMRRLKKKTKLSYYRALLYRVFTFKASEYEVSYNGTTRRFKADFCGMHNCIHAGGGMTLIKHAVMDDGFAELFMVENRGLWRRILNFIAILRKKIHTQPNVQIKRVTDVVIKSPHDSLCCSDGEIYELDELVLNLRPKGIRFFHEAGE